MSPIVINSAVDSLYLSYDSGVMESVISFLDLMQQTAKDKEEPVAFEIDGQKLVIKPYGSRGYTFQLNHEHYLLKVSTSEDMPSLYFQVYASCLYELGHQLAWEKVDAMAKSLGVRMEPKTSRIDICIDFQGWTPSHRRVNDFVTRARKKRLYLNHDKATGFQFGESGPIVARIYNKTEEIEVSKKQWMREVWKKNPDYDESKEVWRLEFQFRIEALKQFGALTVKDTFERLLGLFEYGMDWLSLRRQNASRKERSAVDRNWQVLTKTQFPGASCDRVPKEKKSAEERVLVRGAAGYITSYGALRGLTDPNHVIVSLSKALSEHYARKETTFENVVRKKMEQDVGYRENKLVI